MLFNSIDFLIFFPLVVVVYYVLPKKIRYIWLLITSYYFYMCWNLKYVILIFLSTVITYASGLLLEHIKKSDCSEEQRMKRKKLCVAGSFLANLSILFYYKYFNFIIWNINMVLRRTPIELELPQLDILLPVGISFYTFQALSYTMDVYRDEIYAEKNFAKYALFVSFFPQLVAGPIERSKNLLVQISKERKFSYSNLRSGLFLMLWGLLLKLVLADRVAIVVNTVYGSPEIYPGFLIVLATVLFAFQIYCDFQGYTTIARGAARILGYELMENFNAPYFATSVADFWRRWHISLSSWFRDYLYIPLGGNRKGKARKHLNLMIVFLVSGIWHGASWTYIIWGGLNGAYQVIGDWLRPLRNKMKEKLHVKSESRLCKLVSMVITFVLVDFAWLFFRADGPISTINTLKNLCCFNPQVLVDGTMFQLGLEKAEFWFMWLVIALLMASDYLKYKGIQVMEKINRMGMFSRSLLFAILLWVVIVFGIYGVDYEASQFIYFQF